MIRAWLVAAAFLGFLSMVAGAVGAHLAAGDGAAKSLRTGSLMACPTPRRWSALPL